MKRAWIILPTITILYWLTGCDVPVTVPDFGEPPPQPVTAPDFGEPPPQPVTAADGKRSTAPMTEIVEVEERQVNMMADRRIFTLITDPWSRYFRLEPNLIILPKLTKGIEDLLNEQQQRAREILSNTGQPADRPEYIQLEEELESLKSAVPGAETRSGYGRSRRYSSPSPYSYVSPDGSYAYARSGSSSYYYTVFNRVHKSSSPELARSVENIIYNASLEDLDQRIDGLRQLYRTWSRKTNIMSPNGVEGVMREANMAYLEGIQEYTSEVVQLQGRLKRVQNLIDSEMAKKEARWEEWRSFESNRLPVIQEYVKHHKTLEIEPNNGKYEIPAAVANKNVILLACKIGDRTLYFNLDSQAYSKHPFRLIAMQQ